MSLDSGVGNGIPVADFKLADCSASSSSLTGPAGSSQGDIPSPDPNPFPEIDPPEVRELQNNIKSHGFDELVIVDARFEYEYAGGHITGAINIKSEAEMKQLFDEFSGSSVCLIFYCEFSRNRGPILMWNFRHYDRSRNLSCYPALTYPTIYLLRGGYKEFYGCCPDLCFGGYVPMCSPAFGSNGGLNRSHSSYCPQGLAQPVFSMRQLPSMPLMARMSRAGMVSVTRLVQWRSVMDVWDSKRE
jgi:hypothetical protein